VDSPSAEELAVILDLAGEAAHASERVAAPAACWMAGKAGTPLPDALEAAREVGA
jgi:hypothetical protein